ncbi:hypothetical protein ASC78_08570 [Variovorax sp. Root318D1]|nr:hypothetical protein ASC78_08570 [Variovorax sp. Root318D1]
MQLLTSNCQVECGCLLMKLMWSQAKTLKALLETPWWNLLNGDATQVCRLCSQLSSRQQLMTEF